MIKSLKTKRLLEKYQKMLNTEGFIPNVLADNEVVWILDTKTNKIYYPEIAIAIVR